MRVFHGSSANNIKSIEPRYSSHGTKYVYAVQNKIMALLFMAKWNDFILTLSTEEYTKLEITERYPNAFEDIYKGKSGVIYTLDGTNFKYLNGDEITAEKERINDEVVSVYEESILDKEEIADIYSYILSLDNTEKFALYRYPNRPKCIPDDDGDLIASAINIHKNTGDDGVLDYCIDLHPKLRDAILSYKK